MMKKRLIALVTIFALLLSLSACSDLTDELTSSADGSQTAKTSWSIYWCLCGSDLESGGGFATTDLQEMMEVTLPENVQVVIQTGGASQWQNDVVDASKLQRFVYDKDGLRLMDEQPSASMGDSATLQGFLEYAKTNYPAEKTAVLFWNHGGGSVAGAASDELYDGDALTLDEMRQAFSAVWPLSAEQPPLELIGFDTCLMATVDVANAYADIGHYLVASEEVEPGNGWLYSGWVGDLAKDPSMNGLTLGKSICDNFYRGCEEVGTHDSVTLSVTDLSKVAALVDAYDAFGKEALAAACENPGFFSSFGRAANASENYGGNTREQGFTNMVDLGHLARQSASLLPDTSGAVLNALRDCVAYKINGPYRSEATGLSCYYSYSADLDDFNGYVKVGAGEAFKYYYSYGLTGELDDSGMKYLSALDIDTLPEWLTLSQTGWDNIKPTVDDEGCATLTLGSEASDVLASIGFQLYYVDEQNDFMMQLGTDNDMTADWDNGVFKDNFRGVWGAIDGHLVYMELSFEGDDYNLYSVPVLLNGEECNLMVTYDFSEEAWTILGARRGINEAGMADKELRALKPGDELSTIHYISALSEESEELTPVTMDTFNVTADTAFAETELGDGTFVLIFSMQDVQGNVAYSDTVTFECAGGEILTSVAE